MNDSVRPKNKKRLLILMIILICLFSFFLFYNIMHNLNVKKYISKYLKNNYQDYDIEYVEKKDVIPMEVFGFLIQFLIVIC